MAKTKSSGKRAVGYVRVSHIGKRAGEFISPELQEEAIERWAVAHGIELVKPFYRDLDVSGRRGVHRPEFERMVQDALDGRAEIVCVYNLSRFARSVVDSSTWIEKLKDGGVAFVSVTEEAFDTTTSHGRLMLNNSAAYAQFESERIGDTWRAVHARRRAQGKVHLSRPLYGYTLEKGTVGEVDSEQAEAVLLAYELRARGLGYGAIRRALDEAGYSATNGGRFANSTLGHILRQPAYAGLLREPGGALVEAAHEPIVARELWEVVQAGHSRTTARAGRRASGLLSGLIRCGACGYAMHYQPRSNGSRSNGRKRVSEPVYRCGSRQASGRHRCGKAISATLAEDVVMGRWLAMQGAVLHGVEGTEYGGTLTSRRAARKTQTRDPAAERRATVERTQAAMNALVDRLADGRVSGSTFDTQIARLEQRLEDQRAALAEVEAQPTRVPGVTVPIVDDLEKLRDGLREWVERVEVFPAKRLGGSGEVQFKACLERVRVDWIAPVHDDERLRVAAEDLYVRFAPAPGVHWLDRWPEIVRLLGELIPVEEINNKAAALLR